MSGKPEPFLERKLHQRKRYPRYCWIHAEHYEGQYACPKCHPKINATTHQQRIHEVGDDWLDNDLPLEILEQEI